MGETWEKIICDCGTTNWIYLGDMSDLTRPDTKGGLCRKCGKAYSFFDDEYYEIIGETDDPSNYEIGQESPE